MPLERINPGDLATPQTYTHVIVASGRRLVFVAGQVAEDDQGNLVGPDDLAVQARQAFENVGRALAGARARPDQVAKITIFVADDRHEYLPAIEAARMALFKDHKPVDALIGVTTLAHPGCLIEIEAIAVVDDSRSGRYRFEARAASLGCCIQAEAAARPRLLRTPTRVSSRMESRTCWLTPQGRRGGTWHRGS